MIRSRLFLTLLLLAAALPGCSPRATSYINPAVDFSFIRRVAIFPFQNLSADHKAPARISSIFLSELLEHDGLIVLAPGETLSVLQDMKLGSAEVLSEDQIVELGRRLDVNAVFFGTVEEYGLEQLGRDRSFALTVSFSMAETATGSLIWNSQVYQGGVSVWRKLFGGGTPAPYHVSRKAVRQALETLF
ncbi:MAG: hypothetical protein KOO60_12395 [Gemmatimonadales bacterium]|nr:hypothetical protein [Gemmatimonadales bacterium]